MGWLGRALGAIPMVPVYDDPGWEHQPGGQRNRSGSTRHTGNTSQPSHHPNFPDDDRSVGYPPSHYPPSQSVGRSRGYEAGSVGGTARSSNAGSSRTVTAIFFEISPRDAERDRCGSSHRSDQKAPSYTSDDRSYTENAYPSRGTSSVQSGLRDRRYEGSSAYGSDRGSDNGSRRQSGHARTLDWATSVANARRGAPPSGYSEDVSRRRAPP